MEDRRISDVSFHSKTMYFVTVILWLLFLFSWNFFTRKNIKAFCYQKKSSINKLRIQYGSGILLQKNTGILVVRWNVHKYLVINGIYSHSLQWEEDQLSPEFLVACHPSPKTENDKKNKKMKRQKKAYVKSSNQVQ